MTYPPIYLVPSPFHPDVPNNMSPRFEWFGEVNSPAAPAGIRSRNFSILGPALLPTSYPGSPGQDKQTHNDTSDSQIENTQEIKRTLFN